MLVLATLAHLFGMAYASSPLPEIPKYPTHPAAKTYYYSFSQVKLDCFQRSSTVFLPNLPPEAGPGAVVVFGHGQAMGVEHYRLTFEHLAKRGIAVIVPQYDRGFYDTDWNRMGDDFNAITECAFKRFQGKLNSEQIVYSGHSKGAYVASIAAGLKSELQPRIVLLFEPAGGDLELIRKMDPEISLTVVFAEDDNIVSYDISRSIYDASPSFKKQFITMKSYKLPGEERLLADHFWPQSKSLFWWWGNQGESPYLYYGSWKWLVAAADDLRVGGPLTNEYLFGREALYKGIPGFYDGSIRNYAHED